MESNRQQAAFSRAITFLKNGESEIAEQLCRNAIQEFPDDANFLCLSARALIKLRRYAEAEERLKSASALSPNASRPHLIRGELNISKGNFDQAVDELRRSIELGDGDPETQMKLAKALTMTGDHGAAKKAVDASLRLDPARAELAKAYELEKSGRGEEAEKIYRDMLTRDPGNVDALRLLAGTATSQNHPADAEVLLLRALELAPDFSRAVVDLIHCQIELEKTDEAVRNAKRLVGLDSNHSDSYSLLGSACTAAGNFDDAIQAYENALKIVPRHPGALSSIAHCYKTLGRQDDAIEAYRRCIEFNPYYTESYWSLANMKTFRFTDEEVASMEKLLEHPDIPEDAEIQLCNALGLEYEGREEIDTAFSFYRRYNEIKRDQEFYDPVATEALYDTTIGVFDRVLDQSREEMPDFGVTPIFIIGLPRSGSTLLEQILASHSMVEGTHELSDLSRVARDVPQVTGNRDRYPLSLEGMTTGQRVELGQHYIDRTSKYRSGKPYFIDKNPNNFTHVGLGHLILPNAVFINAKRHPLDSCLGSYKQLFAKGQSFSYDLADIGEYYIQYDRLIEYWNSVLPGKILEVHYEAVVADLETQVRRILQHCGLPFEAKCLHFHETERAVKTPSSEQVRKPIYSSSVNLWRKYEKHLGPLIEILEPVLAGLADEDRPESLQRR